MAKAMMCSFIARVPAMLVLMPSILTSLFADGEAQQPVEAEPQLSLAGEPQAKQSPHAAETKQAEPQPPQPAVDPEPQPQPTQSKKIRPQASFLRDNSLPDGSKVAPNTQITKKWAMRNIAKDSWPASTRLLCVSGDPTPITSIHQEQDGLYNLQATVKTPAKPGRFTLFFRLAHGDQSTLFGDRVWIDVVVEATEEVKAEKPQPQPQLQLEPQPEPQPQLEIPVPAARAESQPSETGAKRPEPNCLYEKQIWDLQDMGFCLQDPLLAADLLRHARGDVHKVIEWFLTGNM